MKQLEVLHPTLDLKSKLYQRSVWPAVIRVAAGETLAAPFTVEIDPTSFCDLACPECVSKDLLNSAKFTKERLIEIANELVVIGVKAVIFVGGGEPLTHPAMQQVIEICGNGGLRIGIITNGTQLHRYTDVLAHHAEWVRVSVDAGTAETFQIFRPHASGKNVFDRVIDNMKALKKAGIRTLGFSVLLMSRTNGENIIESNFSELYQAGVLAKSIGCDYIEIKPVFDPITHIVCDQPPALIRQLKDQLAQLQAIEDTTFKVILAQALIELIDGKFMAGVYNYGKCHVSELRTLISPSGVYLCPLYRGRVEYSFGDPTRESFRDIWNGYKRAQLMDSVWPCRDCLPKCSRHLSNIEIDRISKGRMSSSLMVDFDFFI